MPFMSGPLVSVLYTPLLAPGVFTVKLANVVLAISKCAILSFTGISNVAYPGLGTSTVSATV